MTGNRGELVKASLMRLDSLDDISVDWNPERYSLSRRSQLASVGSVGATFDRVQAAAGGVERFATELFLDNTREASSESGRRDLRAVVEKIEGWMDPDPTTGLPPRVLFLWGSFRFRGIIESLDQVWVRFARDGAPTRGHLRLTLRR